MAVVYAGSSFTFTTLFLDATGLPLVPVDLPTIDVFYMAGNVKLQIVASGAPMSAVAGNVGRYARTVSIPSDLAITTEVYAVMKATDPATADVITVEQTVTVASSSSGSDACGLRVAFVKPAGFP